MLRRDQRYRPLSAQRSADWALPAPRVATFTIAITGGVRLDAGVVEHHRKGGERLADRLSGLPHRARSRQVRRCQRRSASSIRRWPSTVAPGSALCDVGPSSPSATSTRDGLPPFAGRGAVGTELTMVRAARSGSRCAASSPSTHPSADVASLLVRNEPACCTRCHVRRPDIQRGNDLLRCFVARALIQTLASGPARSGYTGSFFHDRGLLAGLGPVRGRPLQRPASGAQLERPHTVRASSGPPHSALVVSGGLDE